MLDEKKRYCAILTAWKKIQTNTVVRDFTCLFLLHVDHFGQHMTGWGPWLFGNNPSQWGSSVPSVQQTHLQSCSICSSSLWQLLSLSFVVTLRCRDATTQKLWQLGCSDNLLTFFFPSHQLLPWPLWNINFLSLVRGWECEGWECLRK